MSTVIAKNIQIGTSGTPAQNFTWYQPASPDGTVRLGVGNTGATTLDAITATSAGNVTVAGSLAGGALSGSSLAVSGATTTGSLTVNSNAISAVNSLGFRNRVINSAATIDQRNAGASVSNIGNGAFIVDRFYYDRAGLGITAQFTASQSTDAPTGFRNSIKLDTTTAQTLGATGGTYIGISHKIEGFNMADLSGVACTLSFWVKATKTGTYSVVLKNSGADRSLVVEYTVSASNTWEQKTLSVAALPTAGTWNYTNGTGLQLFWCVAVADDVATSTIGSWISSNVFGSTSNVEGADSTANDFLITGVQLEAGTVASPFERRDYGRELMMCQRYYWNESSTNYTLAAFSGSSTYRGTRVRNPVPMRASATYTGTVTNGSINIDSLTTLGSRVFVDLGNNTSTSDLTAITASAEL